MVYPYPYLPLPLTSAHLEQAVLQLHRADVAEVGGGEYRGV